MKLRGIAKLCDGKCSILAIYDMCRTDRSKFPELTCRGVDDLYSIEVEGGNEPYFHLSGAPPNKPVPANSVLAERVYQRAYEKAKKHPRGMISIPEVWSG